MRGEILLYMGTHCSSTTTLVTEKWCIFVTKGAGRVLYYKENDPCEA